MLQLGQKPRVSPKNLLADPKALWSDTAAKTMR
jgi:hypothetical protein